MSDLVVSVATPANAPAMASVIRAAFSARPPIDPPSPAINETPATVAATLATGGGIYATVNGHPAGVILLVPGPDEAVSFQRVSVHPEFQRHGIASRMVRAAEDLAAEQGRRRVELFARAEFVPLIDFWRRRGFEVVRHSTHGVFLGAALPLALRVPTAEQMQQLGMALADRLAPGDLIIASGDLGAGKTTLTQGIGRGLGAIGPVISPTFVLSRIHRSGTGRPHLVHVDAYRLGGPDELDDLDLDSTAASAVTVVEWGEGLAEGLADSRLEIDIRRTRTAAPIAPIDPVAPGVADSPVTEPVDLRTVLIRAVGRRWRGVDLQVLDPERAAVPDE